MPGNPEDLLQDPWISTVDADGAFRRRTLPEVLSYLGGGDELEFTALQGHQQQAWHAFMVQLSALALDRVGGELGQDPAAWATALEQLADSPTAWHLVADDLGQPAFFQPPVPEGNLKAFKRRSTSPEILEVLIAAKNHDIKANRYSASTAAEHWAFALLTLQTMEGFLGRGNYGIARMNGGFSSRPEVAYAPGTGWGVRLRRDVEVLRGTRSRLIADFGYSDHGLPLLWLRGWQGTPGEMLALGDLDPFFLEVCRRVRLSRDDAGVTGMVAPSQAPRVEAKELSGNVGDPWTPIRKKDGAALTVSENGFHYRLVVELLFGGDYAQPPCLELLPGEQGDMLAQFRVLTRGQGKTGGFHQRWLPISKAVTGRFSKTEAKASLAADSKWRIEEAQTYQKKVLKPTLLKLLQERVQAADGDGLNWKDERANAFLQRFDQAVDGVFFGDLFDHAEANLTVEEGHKLWRQRLYDLGIEVFEAAVPTLAPAGIHHYRAIARARDFLEGRGRKLLELAPPGKKATATESAPPVHPETSEVPNP